MTANVSPDASSVPHPRFQSLRVHAGSSFKPNLDVLASTAVKGSLSSRLAQHRVAEQKPAPVSTSRSSASLELQHEYLTARRAERLAREAAGRSEPPSQSLPGDANALLSSTPPSTPSSLTPSLPLNRSTEDSKAMEARRQLLLGRRAERLVREANTQSQSRFSQPRLPNRGSASGPEPSRNTPLVVGGLGTQERNTTRISQGKFKSRGGATTRGGMRGGRGRSASGRRAGQGRSAGQDDEWPPEIAEWLSWTRASDGRFGQSVPPPPLRDIIRCTNYAGIRWR
ncbi:hypothetical protein GGX14DRAFT_588905 [Mycena pura]|uniref:Uncharacterized protein n=1 Tax=Mycena pura TaxID=153505 RepID=A0AAD6Y415_9AGAR|nr:hypothetical protein GGX14DRAFT_588905 [Mycena pura]